MKKRKMFVVLSVLIMAVLLTVTAIAAEPPQSNPENPAPQNEETLYGDYKLNYEDNALFQEVVATWDPYVLQIKQDLMAGKNVVLERDIVVDGRYIESITHKYNGGKGNTYISPGIFNVVDHTVTFDLNGHSITYNGHADFFFYATLYDGKYGDYHEKMACSCDFAHGLFFTNGTGDLTVMDSSKDKTGKVVVYGKASGVYAPSPGERIKGEEYPHRGITVTGGTWESYPCPKCHTTGYFLYASHGARLTITDGLFSQVYDPQYQDESNLILHHTGTTKNANIDFSLTKLDFSGGRYIGRDPAEAIYYDNVSVWDTINVVADGYRSFDNGDGSYSIRKPCSVTVKVTPADAAVTITNYCGKVMTPEADGSYILALGDDYTCSASREGYIPGSVQFTAAEQGIVELTLHKHEPSAKWHADPTGHWHTCSGCEERLDYSPHTPGDWIIDTEAKPGVEGEQHKECSVCGWKMGEEIIPAMPKPTGFGTPGDYGLMALLKLHLREFTITAIAGEGGTITPTGETQVRYARSLAYTITPDEGYAVADVLIDGKSIGAADSYKFVRVKKDHTITVLFEKRD